MSDSDTVSYISLSDKVREYILLAFFLIPTIFIFINSYNFPTEVGLFARMSAIVVGLFSILYMLRKYMPDYLIPESDESTFNPNNHTEINDDTDANRKDEQISSEDKEMSEPVGKSEPQQSVKRGVNLSIWSGAYLFTSYLLGFLWTTPIFVLIYGYMRDMSATKTVGLSLLSIAIAYFLMSVTRVPIDEGAITIYPLSSQICL